MLQVMLEDGVNLGYVRMTIEINFIRDVPHKHLGLSKTGSVMLV